MVTRWLTFQFGKDIKKHPGGGRWNTGQRSEVSAGTIRKRASKELRQHKPGHPKVGCFACFLLLGQVALGGAEALLFVKVTWPFAGPETATRGPGGHSS
jgi:hypothetical protein